ncbi:hypothetical protein HHK36_001538 [Tetracentron sinense]|uniref:Kinesin motor domain-containing protein n=1 Tax=Tetracentron sinense TaxID=13715 RepID=A0A834ZW84_TETSI|nr:hypothetical protein HHK36_001538 [Tetracentron sinense]
MRRGEEGNDIGYSNRWNRYPVVGSTGYRFSGERQGYGDSMNSLIVLYPKYDVGLDALKCTVWIKTWDLLQLVGAGERAALWFKEDEICQWTPAHGYFSSKGTTKAGSHLGGGVDLGMMEQEGVESRGSGRGGSSGRGVDEYLRVDHMGNNGGRMDRTWGLTENATKSVHVSWLDRSSEIAEAYESLPDNQIDYGPWPKQSLETIIEMEKSGDRLPNDAIDGRSLLGFSMTSPDLVICTGSPDIPSNGFEETSELFKKSNQRNVTNSVELSLDKGITGLEVQTSKDADFVSLSRETEGVCETPSVKPSKSNLFSEASFELLPTSAIEDKLPKISPPVLSINAGGTDIAVNSDGVNYQEDSFFTGGEVMRTDARIGDAEGPSLYQTARIGNFSYIFQSMEAGNYLVDLHLAEIVFTDGPPGMRVFDIFIQEEKVVSGIDIYAEVGSNTPLVLPDLRAFVNGKEGLSIRFEGIMGNPMVCGISIRKDSPAGFGEVELLEEKEVAQKAECEPLKDSCNCNAEGEVCKLQKHYQLQYKELTETRRALEEFKRENELKSRECQEAWRSLKELQNELMRKSMHVGSLAYAIEGQVKEKTRWFSSMRDLTKRFKILKIEHTKLSEEALACQKYLADMTQMTTTIQSTIKQHVDLRREHIDLKNKFIEGAKERKELYNKVLELKGNIRVFCRCRPLNKEEVAEGASMAIDFDSAKDGELMVKANGAPKKVFKFDAVFSPPAEQGDVFEDTAPFATSVLDGYNVCIFAYGQTGTGKTFTMEGTEKARGVNYRTLEELFRIIRDRQRLFRYEVTVSVLEVYNEQIRDLLVPGSQSGVTAKRLEVRQVAEGIHHVPGLGEAHVNNMNEAWDVLQTGSNARAVGSTNANEHSSRSHCVKKVLGFVLTLASGPFRYSIHCVMVKGENLMNGECTRSKLWLVDLAGSERVAKTDVQGERLKETQNINRSLSALGDVISALAMKSPHIPFRNSKLTHLLQDSLGGDSKTLMFVQISPNESDLSETLCSLNFASRVRGIELGPARKQFDSSELSKYKQMAEKAKQDIKSKDGQIKKMEESVHSLELKMKARDLNNKSLQDKVKELESQLLIERKLARQHVDTKIAEQQQQQQQQQKQQQEEQQCISSMRPPLANRLIGNQKNVNEAASGLGKDLVNPLSSLTENNNYKQLIPPTQMDSFLKYNSSTEKENNPAMAEQPPLPRRTGRLSMCPTVRQVPMIPAPAPRRNSLIPFPTAPSVAPLPPSLAVPKEDTDRGEANCSEQTPWSLRGQKSGTKKLSSILRRSLQKKMYIKSPMQQHTRRGGVNVGMEKVRVSIGSRGRMAQRVLLSNASRGASQVQQKQSQKEKERGWNLGTVTKTVV